MKILITGDSHLAALDRALSAEQDLTLGHQISIRPLGNAEAMHSLYFKDGNNCIEITLDRFKSRIDQLPPIGESPDVVAVSMPFHTLRFLRKKKMWSDYAPASLGKTECHSITNATFKKMVLEQQKYNLEMIQLLQKYVPKVVVLEGPRIFAHHTIFENNDEEVLLEVDRLYRKIMRDELDKLNVSVIDCPVETYSANTGLMNEQYRTHREADYHHASTEFGALTLKSLVGTLDKSDSLGAHVT